MEYKPQEQRFYITRISEGEPGFDSFGAATVAIVDDAMGGIVAYCHREYAPAIVVGMMATDARLESIRASIRAENVSYGELAELQDLVEFIAPGDDELLQWAGVAE